MDRRVDWAALPPLAVTEILSYLTWTDRLHAAQACWPWYRCSLSATLWRRFTFSFRGHCWDPSALMSRHGDKMRDVTICVDQRDETNRRSACSFISGLSDPKLTLTGFAIAFTGDNPLLYAGLDFIRALSDFFQRATSLERVDLSRLDLNIDDHLLTTLYTNNRSLKSVNINNKSIPTLVSSECVKKMIVSCEGLQELSLRHASISEECLEALLEPESRTVKSLVIKCTRQEKFTKDVGSETWARLRSRHPGLRVTFYFDHTCLLGKISHILKPEINVNGLHFITYTRLHEELAQAVHHYAGTLETLVLSVQSSAELNSELLHAASVCKMLKTVRILCPVSTEVVETFRKEHQHKHGFNLMLD